MRRRVATLVLVMAAAAASVAGVAAVNSEPAPDPVLALEGGVPLSTLDAATVRMARSGRPTEPHREAMITAHASEVVAGESWRIVAYRSKQGALCAGVTWPGEGQEMGCAARSEWFARGPVAVSVGARQASGAAGETWETIVLSGLADVARVARIELVATDCSSREIGLDESGFFLGPCLFDNVKPEHTIYKEEILGPVLSVVRSPDYAIAARMINEPRRRTSSFSSHTALSSLSPRKEFEQTSSLRRSVLCTAVGCTGRISCSTTRAPSEAACQAASLPASPPPMM